MAYEVVARRWRPLTFDSVVGQKHVTATLASAIERDRVAHAFLFTGIRGVGKTTIARLLARALNCTGRKGAEPCNECPSCTQILSGSSVDVLEIDGASNRGIDEVRSLIEAAAYRPAGGHYRIYIIDEVHQLTREAFNALLKILEEPPAHVKFLLATTEPHKLPQTVLSRCQRYDFRRLTCDEITAQLAHIVKKDKLEVDKDALVLLAREADGSMRDAQSLLEQVVAASGGRANAELVSQVLGIAGTELLISCVEAVLKREPARVVSVLDEIRRGGFDAERFLNEVLEVVRHVSIARAAGIEAIGASAPEAIRQAAEQLKDLRDPLDLQRVFSSLLRTAEDLRRGAAPELVLEMGLLKAALLESVGTAAEVIEGLRRSANTGGGGDPGARGRPTTPSAGAARSQPPPRGFQAEPPRASGSGAPSPSGGRLDERIQAATAAAAHSAREAQSDEPPLPEPRGQSFASGPGRGAGNHENATDPADSAGSGTSAHWEAFLGFVRDEAGFDLYVTLSNCEVVRMETERIEIRAMVDGFRRRLDSNETLSRLRELASRHFGRPVAVALAGTAGATGALSSHSIEAKKQAQLEDRALSDPLMRTALEVLGGKVGTTKPIEE